MPDLVAQRYTFRRFGPTRRRSVPLVCSSVFDARTSGRVLLIACMHGLREIGYAYGIIGGAGPTGFYERCVGAISIEGSSPGIYAGLLRPKSPPT